MKIIFLLFFVANCFAQNNIAIFNSPQDLNGKLISNILIKGIENKAQKENALVFLTLTNLTKKVINQPDYVWFLLKKGEEEIALSQQSFGYYNTKVVHYLTSNGNNIIVNYVVNLGDPIIINSSKVSIINEGEKDKDFIKFIDNNPLKEKSILNQKNYENYKNQLLLLAKNNGYFDGHYQQNTIFLDTDKNQADIDLSFDAKQRYKFGEINFPDNLPIKKSFLQRFINVEKNQNYSFKKISELKQHLQDSGYFSQVLLENKLNNFDKTVDIEAQLKMNKRTSYALGFGYSTDKSFRGKGNFNHRFINSFGHSLSSNVILSLKEYSFTNFYKIPAKNPVTDYFYISLGGLSDNKNYQSGRLYLDSGYQFDSNNLTQRYGFNFSLDSFDINNNKNTLILFYPYMRFTVNSNKNKTQQQQDGFQLQTELKFSLENIISDVSFFQIGFSTRYSKSFGKNRFIWRTDFGWLWTDNFAKIPTHLRFFAGGDRSIRGYGFEKIGALDKDGNNIGGNYLATTSFELEHYFNNKWGGAIFVDFGDANFNKIDPKFGVGVGVRWRSPIGLFRLDVAHGFDKKIAKEKLRFHINLGAQLDL